MNDSPRLGASSTSRSMEAATAPRPGLTSILAVRDLRLRLRRAQQDAGDVPLRRILALDPLCVLRLLRMAHAPVNHLTTTPNDLDALISTVGTIVVKRALHVPVVATGETLGVRMLWMHSLATAYAARLLAEETGVLDPESAFFFGLIHDLPEWLAVLLGSVGELSMESTETLLEEWNLPESLLAHTRAARHRATRNAVFDRQPQTPVALVSAAEVMADLAGYGHPGATDPELQSVLLASVSREDLVAAQNLRSLLQAELLRLRMDGAEHVPELASAGDGDETAIFPGVLDHGSLADVVSTLQHCGSAYKYRSILTATTAASLRYLDYERAFILSWSPKHQCVWIRAKSDLSPRPVAPVKLLPHPDELRLLENAYHMEIGTRIARRSAADTGLLHTLGADEVLCVPLNVSFLMPSFLVLDRTLSRRPVVLGDDLKSAQALAGTASILNENLLLKRRAQRSQRFALTDPLTRLFNRGVGLSTLERELARARRNKTPLTVLMLDLDEFKELNDQFGHLRGDQALCVTADVLRKTLRKQDTVCRYGGEEFMMVLPETDLDQASVTATRIFTAIESAGLDEGLPLTTSVGLTQCMWDRDTVESVLARADRALYASKSRGRNRFSVDSLK